MTTLLKEAIDKVKTLPEPLQDQIAQELLEEVEWESKWDKTFSNSQDVLDRLAQKALDEFESGKTREMGFGDL